LFLPNRVIICFAYNGESLTLLIRLRTLSPVVSAFILSWSNLTFSGLHSRELSFSPYETEISVFSDQLFPLQLNLERIGSDPWARAHASHNYLIEGVKQQNPRPNDLVIVSDLDEVPMPLVVRDLIEHPPKTFVLLRSHFYYYSLRYESTTVWIRNFVVRYGAIDRGLRDYRGAQGRGRVLPGFTAMHCSYCYGNISEIVRKLQTCQHTEYAHGKYVNPNYIISRILCAKSLFDNGGFRLVDMDKHGLDLPPQAEFMGWRLPFNGLDKMDLNISEIRHLAPCDPILKIVDDKLTGYE
jgi:beta-1,4-mannosyl-glycoprotein beta-1,4-N-acetylglucosaminyltransferase